MILMTSRRRGSRLLAIVGSAAALVMLAGCSGTGTTNPTSSSPGGAGNADAQAIVDAALPPISEWAGPTESPEAATDKTIGIISCAQGAEGCVREAEGATEAAEALGWQVINIDGQGDPQRQLAGMNSLLDQGVDAIVLCSINAASIGDGMSRAQSMDVPVIAVVSPDPEPFGGLASIGPDDTKAGEVLGAYIQTQGGGKIGVFDHNENPAVAQRAKGFLSVVDGGEGTEVIYNQSVTLAQIGPAEQQIMSAFMQANPTGTVDWIYAGFDAMLTPLIQSAERQGRTELKAVSIDGNLENLGFIRDGNIEVATVGYPLEWAGWGAIDNLNRVFAGEEIVDQAVPFRLLTKDNLPAEGQPYVGDYDFRAEYTALWGK